MRKKINTDKASRNGFTLIEILIVVAIIAILASIVLVGIGPTEKLGRDSRRVSDLHEVQTALELYYSKCGYYPGDIPSGSGGACTGFTAIGGYSQLVTVIQGSGLGVNTMPNDPTVGANYYYAATPTGDSYILEAKLENSNGSAFSGYNGANYPVANYTAGDPYIAQNGCAAPNYCLTL